MECSCDGEHYTCCPVSVPYEHTRRSRLKRLKFRAHISRNRHGTRAFDECLLADFCEAEARSVLALSAHLTKLSMCVDALHEACANHQLIVLVSDIDFWQYMTTPTAHAQRVDSSHEAESAIASRAAKATLFIRELLKNSLTHDTGTKHHDI